MTMFEDRERVEEMRFSRDLEQGFRVRNRRNKLLALWLAEEHLGLSADQANAYAKDMVLLGLAHPHDEPVMARVRSDLDRAGKSLSDHLLQRHLAGCERRAAKELSED